jgi:transposase
MNPSMHDQPVVVIGVDTHKQTHTAAAVEAATGGVVEQATASADPAGYQRLLDAADRASATVGAGDRLWAIEGAGSYGAGLTRWLTDRGEVVVEMERPKRPARRHGAKSDAIDAVRAAREALGRPVSITPKRAGSRAAIAARLSARRGAVEAATAAINQLHALAVVAPEPLRSRLHGGRTDDLVAVCARLRGHASHDVETAQLTVTLRSLARRVRTLRAEAAEHETALRDLVDAWRSDLLDVVGVGPIVAAVVLSAWSHSGRVPSEAAFAHLAGAAPIPASSGQTVRHRLCRSGDRQLNRALHTIAMTRMRIDPTTQAYVARRRAEGKTDREIRRCLKRYIARQLFRRLERGASPT